MHTHACMYIQTCITVICTYACTHRHRDRQTDRDRHRHIDTDTDRHTDTDTHGHTDRHRYRHTDTHNDTNNKYIGNRAYSEGIGCADTMETIIE